MFILLSDSSNIYFRLAMFQVGIVRYCRHNSQQDRYNYCSNRIYQLNLFTCLTSMYHVLDAV